jgi:hypothetical protein
MVPLLCVGLVVWQGLFGFALIYTATVPGYGGQWPLRKRCWIAALRGLSRNKL